MRILLAKVVVAVPNGSLTSIGGREAQTFLPANLVPPEHDFSIFHQEIDNFQLPSAKTP